MVESFEPAEAASTAFETETPWPGGGKAWAVEVYFGFEPDEEGLRELVAAAAGDDAADHRLAEADQRLQARKAAAAGDAETILEGYRIIAEEAAKASA